MKHIIYTIFLWLVLLFRSLLALFDVQKFSVGPLSSHRCVANSYNRIKCFGWNGRGQLGLGDTLSRGNNINSTNNDLPEVYLGYDVMEISVGYDFTCVLSYNNLVRCFGGNTYGQLGIGNINSIGDNELINNLKPINFGTNFTPIKIRSGRYHSCALSNTNQIKCWGRNNYGQLGIGNTNNKGDNTYDILSLVSLGSSFIPKDIELGGYHSCAISIAGNVKCWGDHSNGQLGLGASWSILLLPYMENRGISSLQMGSSLPEVSFGSNFDVKQLALGDLHSCALSTQNLVKCWGEGANGRLGYGDTIRKGDYVPGVSYDMGDSLPVVSFGTGFTPVYIAAGNDHTCALSNNNSIKCWGQFDYGQLGSQPAAINYNQNPATMDVVSLGDNFTPISIIIGLDYSCAISTQNISKCWGRNTFGELCLGDTNHRGLNISYMGNSLPIIQLGDDLIPTYSPSQIPSELPTQLPTQLPSEIPSELPSRLLSQTPSMEPTLKSEIQSEISSPTPTMSHSLNPKQELWYIILLEVILLTLFCFCFIGFIWWYIKHRKSSKKNANRIEVELQNIKLSNVEVSPQIIRSNSINDDNACEGIEISEITKKRERKVMRHIEEIVSQQNSSNVNSEGIIKNRKIESYSQYKNEGKNEIKEDENNKQVPFAYEKPINEIIIKKQTTNMKLDFIDENSDSDNNVSKNYDFINEHRNNKRKNDEINELKEDNNQIEVEFEYEKPINEIPIKQSTLNIKLDFINEYNDNDHNVHESPNDNKTKTARK